MSAYETYFYAQTNWERYFGSPAKAAHTVSCLVDRWDAMTGGEEFHSEFTDRLDAECEYGLVHTSTLEDWLCKVVEHGD